MTLQQLKQVITIADAGSMNEAAKQLFVSQSTLSAVVKELEAEIDVRLFIRTNRGIRLTPQGEEFVGYARQIVDECDLLQRKYKGIETRRKFSVSCQHDVRAVRAFADLVKEEAIDTYEFAIHETNAQGVIDHVSSFNSEIGIVHFPEGNEDLLTKMFKENEITFEPLFVCDTQVYLWEDHPLAQSKQVTMADLAPYPYLAFDQGNDNAFSYAEVRKNAGDPRKIIRADDRGTMLRLMAELDGYLLGSDLIDEELKRKGVCTVSLAQTQRTKVGYLRHKGVNLSKLGHLYLEKVRAQISRSDVRNLQAEEQLREDTRQVNGKM